MKEKAKITKENKPFLALSGKNTAGWAGMIVFSFAMIFFLGTFVGRGSIKIDLGQKELSQEVNTYAKSLANIKSDNVELIDDTPDLIFYETLEKKEVPKAELKQPPHPKADKKVKKVVKRKISIYKPKVASTPKKKEAITDNQLIKNSTVYKYAIQVASFRGLADAKKTVTRFKTKGYLAYYVKAVVRNNETWYRVRVGAFKDRIDAKNTLLRLEKNNIDGFLVTR